MNFGARFKRVVAGLASFLVLANLLIVPTASAQNFKDVSKDSWAYPYIQQLVDEGVISSDAEYYRPADKINRAELVKLAVEGSGVGIIDDLPETATFEDVPRDAWFGPYVETAVKLGWVEGYRDASGNLTGKFGPGDNVTRAAATKIMINAYGVQSAPSGVENPFNDVKSSDWFYEYVVTAYWNRIVSGYADSKGNLTGKFGPADPITREQAAKITVNAGNPDPMEPPQPECEADSDCEEGEACVDGECEEVEEPECEVDSDCEEDEICKKGFCRPESVPGEGALEVMIDEEDAGEDRDIPFNATRVTYLPLILTAHSASSASLLAQDGDGITVYELRIVLQGLGRADDIDEIWAEDKDGNVISVTVSFNNDDEAFLRFPGGLFVPYGESMNVFVVASMDAEGNGGDTNRFAILSEEDVDSTAVEVHMDAPLAGPTLRVSNYGVSVLDVVKQGNDREVDVGDLQTEIARFQLTNDGDEDIVIYATTFKLNGSLDYEHLANLSIFRGSKEVTEVVESLTSDYVTFKWQEDEVLNANAGTLFAQLDGGRILEEGNSRTYTVKADIIGGEDEDDLKLELDEGSSDFVAFEKDTGFGVKVEDGAGKDANNLAFNEITVNAGDLNIAKDPSTPNSDTYADNTEDVVMLVARLTSAVDLQIKEFNLQMKVEPGADAIGNKFSDVFDDIRAVLVTPDEVLTASIEDKVREEYENGEVIGSENAPDDILVAGNNDIEINFDSTWYLSSTYAQTAAGGYTAGSSLFAANKVNYAKLIFTADILDAGTDNWNETRFKAVLKSDDFVDVEYVSSGDENENVAGTATGPMHEIGDDEIFCSRTDGISNNELLVAGNQEILFAEFACRNSSTSNIEVSELEFDFGEGTTDIKKNTINNVRLYVEDDVEFADSTEKDGWVQVDSAQDPRDGATIVYNTEFIIPEGDSVKMRVYGSTDSDARDGAREFAQISFEEMRAFDKDGDDVKNITHAGGDLAPATPLLGPKYKLIESGLVVGDVSGNTPDGEIAVGGWDDYEFARFTIEGINDSLLVKNIKVYNYPETLDQLPDDTVTSGRLSTIRLYGPSADTTASTLLATKEVELGDSFFSGDEVEFDLTNYMRVAEGRESTLRITGDINPVGNNETGKFIQFRWGSMEVISESNNERASIIKVDDDTGIATDDVICFDSNFDEAYGADEGPYAVTDDNDGDGLITIQGDPAVLPSAGVFVSVSAAGTTTCPAYAEDTKITGKSSGEEFIIAKTVLTLTHESLGTSAITIAAGLPVYRATLTSDEYSGYLKRWTLQMNLSGIATTGGFEVHELGNTSNDYDVTALVDVDGDLIFGEYGTDGLPTPDGGDDDYNADTSASSATGDYQGWTGSIRVQYDFDSPEIISDEGESFEFVTDITDLYTGTPLSPTEGTDSISVRTSEEKKATELDVDADTVGIQVVSSVGDMTDSDNDKNMMIWSDGSSDGHDENTDDWFNGAKLQIPSTYETLSNS